MNQLNGEEMKIHFMNQTIRNLLKKKWLFWLVLFALEPSIFKQDHLIAIRRL